MMNEWQAGYDQAMADAEMLEQLARRILTKIAGEIDYIHNYDGLDNQGRPFDTNIWCLDGTVTLKAAESAYLDDLVANND